MMVLYERIAKKNIYQTIRIFLVYCINNNDSNCIFGCGNNAWYVY